MEFFHKAKAVRMRNIHEKYLMAEEDVESVTQERNGSDKRARWTVEPVRGSFEAIRLKSCYGSYLTASNERFLLGATGRKVVLSKLSGLDSSVEWEPVREGSKVKLKTRQGHFLRGNGGLPPWRDSVTHDSRRSSDSFLWDVDVVETTSLALVPVATPPLHRRQSSPPMSRTSSEKSEQEVGIVILDKTNIHRAKLLYCFNEMDHKLTKKTTLEIRYPPPIIDNMPNIQTYFRRSGPQTCTPII
ncbi:unnamed protein product [Brassica oleracea]